MNSMVLPMEPTEHQQRNVLEYPFAPPLPDASVVEVAKGILWLRMPLPMALDHINLYLLEDDNGWYLFDTGINIKQVRQLWLRVIESHCKGKPIKGVICSHFHYDHSSLASWLMERYKVPLYMTHGEFFTLKTMSNGIADLGNPNQLDFYRQAGLPYAQLEVILERCRKDPFIKYCPPSYNRIREGEEFKIGERHWKIIIGEGHSPEHACFYSDKDKILLAGDQVLPDISSNILVNESEPLAQPLKHWLASLERLKLLSPETLVLPAHGTVFKQLHLRIQQLTQHHLEQLDLLRELALHKPGFNAYQAMQHLFRRSLSPIETMMALGESLAHLNWLESNAELECLRDEASGASIYLPTRFKKMKIGTSYELTQLS